MIMQANLLSQLLINPIVNILHMLFFLLDLQ